MSVNAAVKKFHADVDRMNRAKSTEAKATGALSKAASTEKAQLASIATQRTAIVDAFESTTTPLTAAQQTADLNQMFALGKKQVEVTDAFGKTSAKDRAAIVPVHRTM